MAPGGRLYSDFGVQVRVAGRDAGAWCRPPVAQLDDFRYYAAKTAFDGERRLMFGFVFGRTAAGGVPTDGSPWTWGGVMALQRVALPPDLAGAVPLRIYLDGTILEAFVADRLSFTARRYDVVDAPRWGLAPRSETLVASRVRMWRLGIGG